MTDVAPCRRYSSPVRVADRAPGIAEESRQHDACITLDAEGDGVIDAVGLGLIWTVVAPARDAMAVSEAAGCTTEDVPQQMKKSQSLLVASCAGGALPRGARR